MKSLTSLASLTSLTFAAAVSAVTIAAAAPAFAAAPGATPAGVKPTVILVHGAFADSASWDGVSAKLQADGYTVIGAANPLRSVKGDGEAVASIVKSVPGPVVLVGHSYGGSVISAAAVGNANVRSLVFVAAFAPDAGESALQLSTKFPGATLGPTLAPPVTLADGGKDLYIRQDKFPAQFAADLPLAKARLMAVGQRPITEAAINEASGEAGWKNLPSYFVYGTADKNIPEAANAFMADRAHSRHTVVIKGASHVVMTSHPAEVARLIEEAAAQ
jgi:pimeloyl-ACP methyl ester carboxylesterase